MSKARPTYPQIRSRQRYVIDYLHSTGKTYKQGARDFNVTPSQLKDFIERSPRKLRKSYSLNKNTQKLYEAGGKRHTADIRPLARAQEKRLERVHYKLPQVRLVQRGMEPAAYEQYTRAAGLIRNLYVTDEATEWNIFTLDRGLPISIRTIREMYDRGDIDDDDYYDIVDNWREIYNVPESVSA